MLITFKNHFGIGAIFYYNQSTTKFNILIIIKKLEEKTFKRVSCHK